MAQMCRRCSRKATNGIYCTRHALTPELTRKPSPRQKRPGAKVTAKPTNTRKWFEFSKQYRIDHPLCVCCKLLGRRVPSTEVDHIIPCKVRPDIMYDESNLQALCGKCHRKKAGFEYRGIYYDYKLKRVLSNVNE